jgi:hypothetical protein
MKFYVKLNDHKVKMACLIVSKHFKDEEFLLMVEKVDKFNDYDGNGKDVAKVIRNFCGCQEIDVEPYKTVNPWSSVVGYAKDKKIFINTRKLHLPLGDRVENIYHEFLHLCGFSHSGNRPDFETVPYKVSNMFFKYCLDKGII